MFELWLFGASIENSCQSYRANWSPSHQHQYSSWWMNWCRQTKNNNRLTRHMNTSINNWTKSRLINNDINHQLQPFLLLRHVADDHATKPESVRLSLTRDTKKDAHVVLSWRSASILFLSVYSSLYSEQRGGHVGSGLHYSASARVQRFKRFTQFLKSVSVCWFEFFVGHLMNIFNLTVRWQYL